MSFDDTANDKFITVTKSKLIGGYTLDFKQVYADGSNDTYTLLVLDSLKLQPGDLLRKFSRARNNLRLNVKDRQLVEHDGLTLADYIKQLETKA